MRPNVFAGPHVDRLKLANADAEAVARAIAERFGPADPGLEVALPGRAASVPRAYLLPIRQRPLRGDRRQTNWSCSASTGASRYSRPRSRPRNPPALDDGAEFADLRLAASLLPHEDAGLRRLRARDDFVPPPPPLLRQLRRAHCAAAGTAASWSARARAAARNSSRASTPPIIVLVTDGDRALLGRQPGWPAGRYSTIAGFVEPGESLEDAVRREVLEETGIETGAMSYQSSQPWPFPRSLMLGFRARGATTEVRIGDRELEDARWFHRDELAGGSMMPFSQSIAYRLIQEWLNP